MIEGAEFGHLDEHDQGSRFTDAWDAGQDVEAGLEGEIGCESVPQGGVDRGDLTFDLG